MIIQIIIYTSFIFVIYYNFHKYPKPGPGQNSHTWLRSNPLTGQTISGASKFVYIVGVKRWHWVFLKMKWVNTTPWIKVWYFSKFPLIGSRTNFGTHFPHSILQSQLIHKSDYKLLHPLQHCQFGL